MPAHAATTTDTPTPATWRGADLGTRTVTYDERDAILYALAVGARATDLDLVFEDRLRRVETAVRKLDEEHWNRTDPEKVARADSFAGQLAAAIAKLEAELAAAKAGGDKKKIADAQEALDARKAWLGSINK